MRKRGNALWWLVGVGCFLTVFVAVFFGVQAITGTGLFKVPGVVSYDGLTEPEEIMFREVFNAEVVLDRDVRVSARYCLGKPELAEGEFVTEVLVPVTDFYSTIENVDGANSEAVLTGGADGSYEMIGIGELDFNRKLLSINGQYYLDDFKNGAVFRVISFKSEKYGEEIAPLVANVMKRNFPDSSTVLTLAQTGVTALSRGMNEKLSQVGDARFFAEKIGGFLSQFDYTHTSNEASFSEYAGARNICSDPRFIDTLTAIGLDIVELTGNHNLDCGDEDALATIDLYGDKNIRVVGGGKTATDASSPLEISDKGSNITMLAFNESTGGATYDNTPGANQYDEDLASAQIAEAKARGDLVIVDVQYYECSMYVSEVEDATCDYANSAAGDQVGFFRHLIDLGADVVVGTSAHQPQTFELYGDGVIYYGLGNLFFDQAWWPGTTRSLVLVHHIYKGKLLQTQILPTQYDDNYQPELLESAARQWFLGRLIEARP